jgi:hypothetical protein
VRVFSFDLGSAREAARGPHGALQFDLAQGWLAGTLALSS